MGRHIGNIRYDQLRPALGRHFHVAGYCGRLLGFDITPDGVVYTLRVGVVDLATGEQEATDLAITVSGKVG